MLYVCKVKTTLDMETIVQNDVFKLSFYYGNSANALFDSNGIYIMVNQKYCELLGYSDKELLGTNVSKVISYSDVEVENQAISNLFLQNSPYIEYQSIRKTKEGTLINVSVNAISIPDEKSNKRLVLKQLIKATEERNLQAEINQKQFLLDTIMTEMPMHIYFKDLNSKFILSSSEQAKYFKVNDAKKMIGKTDFDYFSDEHAQKAYNDEQRIIETGIGIKTEEKLTWPNGSITWVHSIKQPLKDSYGRVQGTFGISTDITETVKSKRKEKEAGALLERKNKELEITLKSLKETQDQLVSSEKMAALGQLISGIAHEINTPLGAINASNSNITYSLKKVFNILPRLYTNFNPTEVQFISNLLKTARFDSNHVQSREQRILRKQISEKLHSAGIPQSRNLADHIIYMNIHDQIDELIPKLKTIDAEKCLEASKLLISLSKNSNNILLATEKASSVVLALKKFIHRKADGTKTPTNLQENIDTVLTLNQNKLKHGIELIKKYEAVPSVEAYPDELSQVWNNIITNAIQAMEGKGTLTLELLSKDSETVSVRISDTGCGIPEELKEKIFIPLFTTKVSGEGTGIGLDIVKRILDRHQAVLSLESVVDKGTTFTIDLPIKPSL